MDFIVRLALNCLSKIYISRWKLGTKIVVHKIPRGRLNKTLPCTRNKSVTWLLSTICVDNEPIKRHLINDCSNLKKKNTLSLPTLVFIYLSNQQKCAKFKGVYTHNKTNVLQCKPLHYTYHFVRKIGVNRWTLRSSEIGRLWSQQAQYATSYLYKRLSFLL